MGTEILRPRDCLARSAPTASAAGLFPRRRPNPNPNPNPHRKPRPEAKKGKSGLAMGQVTTMLKRGEVLNAAAATRSDPTTNGWDPVMFGTSRLGPDPAMVPSKIRVADPNPMAGRQGDVLYAGTAFDLSPSPRALPVPKFATSARKDGGGSMVVVDSLLATENLRRLLRLN